MQLTDLPTELVERIASYLHQRDLLSLRQTSFAISEKSFHQCGAVVFSTICKGVSPGNLNYLSEFAAQHPRVAEKVKRFHPCDSINQVRHPRWFGWHRDEIGRLVSGQEGFARLTELLRDRFPNCKEFHINHRWLYHLQGGSVDVLSLVDEMLVADGVEIEKLNFDLGSTSGDLAWRLMKDGLQAQEWLTFTATEESLLGLARKKWAAIRSLRVSGIFSWFLECGWLRKALPMASGLQRLELSFDRTRCGTLDAYLPASLSLKTLKCLKLENVSLSAETLEGLIANASQSLESLGLSKVMFPEDIANTHVWVNMLRQIVAVTSKLQSISLDHVGNCQAQKDSFLGFNDVLGIDIEEEPLFHKIYSVSLAQRFRTGLAWDIGSVVKVSLTSSRLREPLVARVFYKGPRLSNFVEHIAQYAHIYNYRMRPDWGVPDWMEKGWFAGVESDFINDDEDHTHDNEGGDGLDPGLQILF